MQTIKVYLHNFLKQILSVVWPGGYHLLSNFFMHASSVVHILHPVSKILFTVMLCHPKSEGLTHSHL